MLHSSEPLPLASADLVVVGGQFDQLVLHVTRVLLRLVQQLFGRFLDRLDALGTLTQFLLELLYDKNDHINTSCIRQFHKFN